MEQAGQEQYQEMLKRKEDELDIIIDIGKTLTSSINILEVPEIIMKKVSNLLNPKVWSLLLVDESTGELYFRIAVSPVTDQLKDIRLKIGEGVAGWVALHGEPLLIKDVRNDDRFARQVDEKVMFSTKSIACVPMKLRNRVIGVIELINSLDEAEFTPSDMRILDAIADYAAIAIDNARNFARISELVITDDLTGLFNASHFHERLDREVEYSHRYSTNLSLVFLDLDHFKNVNDTYGHLVGSRLISEFGRLLKKHVRATDIGARYGGDEFVFILPNTSKDEAVSMVKNLRRIIAENVFFSDNGEQIKVTASYGIATYPADADTKQALIRAADMAMYRIKETTRDAVNAY